MNHSAADNSVLAESRGEPINDFRFACHRCGNCCRHGEGYVWLKEGDSARMAQALGLEKAAFERRFTKHVTQSSPMGASGAAGATRLSLKEETGRCVLLEGDSHCSVYGARPAQCRSFPYWPSITEDAEGLERARAICPGIEVSPSDDVREAAFEGLKELYQKIDSESPSPEPSVRSCPFSKQLSESASETAVYASGLEVDYALRAASFPEEAHAGCPYFQSSADSGVDAGVCTAPGARPLTCRVAAAVGMQKLQSLMEIEMSALRSLEKRTSYPKSYGLWSTLLMQRSSTQK